MRSLSQLRAPREAPTVRGSGASFTAVADDEDPDGWIGRIVDGRYRVAAQVGSGGMGTVYRVEHVRMGKVAAMKVLRRELASQPGAIKRFRREVEAVSLLDHPNIVQTFDCGYADGQLYLVMEYVRGEDLSAIVWRDGPLPAPRALALGIQVCAALEEAHEHGVVHCDLKPDNIVCARRRDSEQAKVLDFGLAKLRAGAEPGDPAGELLGGTPNYMSPEQVRFEGVDARSDLYSLGATLYRLVTGEAAFQASSPVETMTRQLTEELVAPSLRAPALRLPGALDEVILRAMARAPDDRYGSAAEMREQLQAAFDRITGVAPRWSTGAGESSASGAEALGWEDFDAFERGLRRRRWLRALAAPPLLVGGLAAALWAGPTLLGDRPAREEHEPNDLPGLAGLLPRGQVVLGEIGAARADGQPDFDYYRVPPGRGTRALEARLTGVPGVDLVLELFDEGGRLLARANAAPAGGEERLGPVALGPGAAFVRARPLWVEGEAPAARGGAPYGLTVDWGPPRPGWELEPNDTPERANLVDGASVTGVLASADDVDWYRVRVPPGSRVEGRVDGLDGIDLVLLVGDARAAVDPVDARGSGEHESFAAAAPLGELLIGVGQRGPGAGADRGEPYTLKLKVRPGAED